MANGWRRLLRATGSVKAVSSTVCKEQEASHFPCRKTLCWPFALSTWRRVRSVLMEARWSNPDWFDAPFVSEFLSRSNTSVLSNRFFSFESGTMGDAERPCIKIFGVRPCRLVWCRWIWHLASIVCSFLHCRQGKAGVELCSESRQWGPGLQKKCEFVQRCWRRELLTGDS